MFYYISPSNDDIQHHGIQGQKWGVQNGPPYPLKVGVGKLINRIKRNAGDKNTKTLKKAKTKDLNKMSDRELERTTKRLRLERDFANLTEGNIAKGKKFVDGIEKSIVAGVITGVAIEIGKEMLKKKLSGGSIVVFPKY